LQLNNAVPDNRRISEGQRISIYSAPAKPVAAGYEERITSLLDAHGNEREAAVHRVSAASCYHKARDPSRATNLYRAALAGPLRAATRKDVEAMLAECLASLSASPPPKAAGASAEG
jgi:hypothetical protein